MGLLLVLGFLPFLYATQFVYPLSIHEWDWLGHFSGKTSGLNYWQTQQHWYQHTGGRYTSTALLSTLPYWYDLTRFRLAVLLFVLALPLSFIYALMRLTQPVLGFLLGASCWLLFLDQLTNTYDSLLRFTCLPIYHMGFTLTFLIGLGWWRAARRAYPLSWETLGLAVLSFLAVGTNELTLVHVGLLLFLNGGCVFYEKRKLPVIWLIIAAVTLAGSAVALSAPGNFARMELYSVEVSLFKTLGLSVAVSMFLVVEWLTNSLLLPVMLCLSLFYQLFFRYRPIAVFEFPWFWLAGTLVLVPVSLFPLLYGTGGSSLPERVVDLLFLCFSILLFGTALSLQQRWCTEKSVPNLSRLGYLAGTVLIVFVIFNLFLGGLSIDRDPSRRRESPLSLVRVEANVGRAYLQIFRGIPQQYAAEMEAMEQQARTCVNQICLVKPLTVPEFIGYDALYDRRWSGGESGQNAYWGLPPKTIVKYSN